MVLFILVPPYVGIIPLGRSVGGPSGLSSDCACTFRGRGREGLAYRVEQVVCGKGRARLRWVPDDWRTGMMRFWIVLLLCIAPRLALADVCAVGCPCGNTCIDCSDVCHVGGESGPPKIGNGSVAGAGYLLWAGGLCFSIWAQLTPHWSKTPSGIPMSTTLAALGLIWPVASMVTTLYVADKAREQSGDDPSGIVTSLWIANSLLVAWDIVIMTGLFKRTQKNRMDWRHYESTVFFDPKEFEFNLSGLAVAPYGDGLLAPNLMGFTF